MTLYPNGIDNPTTLPPATGDDATSVNANIGATEAIETELGILPSGVYASVRTRLDILEARINNPFAPSPDVTNPFFIGNSGVSIQDGYGDPNVRGILAAPGSLFLRVDGYNIQGLYAFRDDGSWHQIDTDPWTAAGDLSGTIYSQTVRAIQGVVISGTPAAGYVLEATSPTAASWQSTGASITLGGDATGPADANTVVNIHGASVPVSGSLTTGNVLQVSGPAALIYAPVNLAGGANFVAGVLPIGNQAPQSLTLTGDVLGTGTTAGTSTTVHSIQGVVISGTPAAGQVIAASSPTAASWQDVGAGTIILSGDVTGAGNANTIMDIQGTPITISAPVLGNYVYYGPSNKLINGSLGSLKIEWFSPLTSDLGIAIQAAHNSLPAENGGIIDATGLRGNWTWNTPVNINRPIKLILDSININSTTQSMFTVQNNFTLSGTDGYATQIFPQADGYLITFVEPYLNPLPTFKYGINYFILERLGVTGGSTVVNTAGFTGLFEADICVQDCVFTNTTYFALIFNSSFYYSRVFRNLFASCYGSALVFDDTETLFRDNVHEVEAFGAQSILLINPDFVNIEQDRFFGEPPNVNPDVEIQIEDSFSWTGGYVNIRNAQFRGEREEWLSQNRVRIRTSSTSISSDLNGSVYVNVDGCWFLGPGALTIASIGRSSGVVTATITCNVPQGHGLQVGDQVQVVTGMSDSSFLGTFAVTAVGTPGVSQTVSWNQAGSNSSQSSKGGLLISLEVAAVRFEAPIGRWTIENNNFESYAFAVDDDYTMTLVDSNSAATRDITDRSLFTNNTMIGSIGYQCQEFKLGGRFFSKVDVGEDSPLVGFNAVPNNKEQPFLQNRIARSENQSLWDVVGACSVTTGAVDPYGTTRACHISRTGATPFCSANGGVEEGIQLGINAASLPTQSFVKFWAKGGPATNLASLNILADVASVDQQILFRTISLSQNWKQYKIPVVWPANTTAAFVGYTPGSVDAMVADGYTFGFQVSDSDCDYVATTSTAYSDSTFGSMFQKPLGFNSGLSVGTGGISVTIPDPSNLFLTEAQSYAPFIDVSGALTAERVVIVSPIADGQTWLVRNSTTGGFPIVVFGGVGESNPIYPGVTRQVFSDGTSIYDIVPLVPRTEVTTTTANPYNVVATDQLIAVGAITVATTINLPSTPATGDTYKIKDATGIAATHNIIVSGNGNNIDGSATYTLVMNYAALTVTFTGVEWSVV